MQTLKVKTEIMFFLMKIVWIFRKGKHKWIMFVFCFCFGENARGRKPTHSNKTYLLLINIIITFNMTI